MVNRRVSLMMLCLMISVFFIACGGIDKRDDAPKTSNAPSVPSVPLKTSSLRIEQPGDSWSASISGVYSDETGTYPLTGMSDIVVLTATKTSPVSGVACNIEESTSTITIDSDTMTGTDYTYFTQDASGYYLHGEGDDTSDNWITSPARGFVREIASPVSVGDADSATVAYSNGDTETASYEVLGKEYVSAGDVNYESYKIRLIITTNYASGAYTKQTTSSLLWLVPGLSSTVREDHHVALYAGSTIAATIQFTDTLTSTNVAY